MTGKVTYSVSTTGNYMLTIVAMNSNYDTSVRKRMITVPDGSDSCAVNLINDGLVASGSTVSVQFSGAGQVSGFVCYTDQQAQSDCKSI